MIYGMHSSRGDTMHWRASCILIRFFSFLPIPSSFGKLNGYYFSFSLSSSTRKRPVLRWTAEIDLPSSLSSFRPSSPTSGRPSATDTCYRYFSQIHYRPRNGERSPKKPKTNTEISTAILSIIFLPHLFLQSSNIHRNGTKCYIFKTLYAYFIRRLFWRIGRIDVITLFENKIWQHVVKLKKITNKLLSRRNTRTLR